MNHLDQIAATGLQQSVDMWDANAGQLIRSLRMHALAVRSVAWSPDGSRLASSGVESGIRIYAADPSAQQADQFSVGEYCEGLSWSEDGQQLFATTAWAKLAAWSPSRKKGSGTVVQSTQRAVPATVPDPFLHAEYLRDIRAGKCYAARSADGRRVALTFEQSGQVLVVDTSLGVPIARFQAGEGVTRVAFSPDGRLLASAGESSEIYVWDAGSGEMVRKIRGHTHSVHTFAWTPDSSRLASGSSDKTIRVWDVETGEPLLVLRGHQAGVSSVAWNHTGTRLASGDSLGGIRVWSDSRALEQQRGYRPRGELTPLDLQPLASQPLDEPFHRGINPNYHLGALTRGASFQLANESPHAGNLTHEDTQAGSLCHVLIGGVRYAIGPKLIQLYGEAAPHYPTQALGINCDRKVSKLHFLHATGFGGGKKGQIGEYRVHFDDQSVERVPIVLGEDVRDWVEREGTGIGDVARGRIVWQTPDELGQPKARLFHSVWVNPNPKKTVTTIDFVSSRTNAAPFCVAITAEEIGVPYWLARGDAHRDNEELDAAIDAYSEALNVPGPLLVFTLSDRAELYARIGQWEKAAADYGRALKSGFLDNSHWPWYRQAFLLAHLNDPTAFRAHRDRILERFADSESAVEKTRIAKACLLLADDTTDTKRTLAMSEPALREKPDYYWYQLTQALALCRDNRHADALDIAKMVPDDQFIPHLTAQLIQAISQHHMGNDEAARDTIAKADARLPRVNLTTESWHDALFCLILRREAAALLEIDDNTNKPD